MKIEKILENVPFYLRGLTEYYPATQLLQEFSSLDAYVEDESVLIVPFYIKEKAISKSVLEIYEYELGIWLVDHPFFEERMLKLFRKNKLDEIDQVLLERHRNCYIEIFKGENRDIKEEVVQYLIYIINNEKLARETKDYLGEFELEKLFFAVY